MLDAGMASATGRLLDRADAVVSEHPDADDVIERIRRQQLRCRIPPSVGGSAEPIALLRGAAAEVHGVDPDVAVDLLFDALAAYIRDGAFADMASAIEESMTLRDRVDERRRRRIDIMSGALRIARGVPGGEPLLDRYTEISGGARLSADALFLAEVLAPSLAFLRRTAASDALLDDLDADLRARGAVRPLISVLGAAGRRAVRPVVPGDDGGRPRGDRARRVERDAGAGLDGGRACSPCARRRSATARRARSRPSCSATSRRPNVGRWARSGSATSPSTRAGVDDALRDLRGRPRHPARSAAVSCGGSRSGSRR